MTLPDQPWAVQVNWNDSEWALTGVNPWDQAHANILMDCWQELDLTRWSFRGSLRGSTCRIRVDDASFNIRPGKLSSSISPNWMLGRRVRILKQTALGSGNWEPWFFGYISDYQPDASDPTPGQATLTIDDPISILAPADLALPLSTGAVVWSASDPDHSALREVFKANHLWETDFLDLDDVGAVALPDTWANATKTFGQWMSDLCGFSNCILSAEPRYATSASDPDFVLHWYQPLPTAAATFHWSATNGELEPTPQLQYAGELPPL